MEATLEQTAQKYEARQEPAKERPSCELDYFDLKERSQAYKKAKYSRKY